MIVDSRGRFFVNGLLNPSPHLHRRPFFTHANLSMATLAKATPFALRNLPSPEEWQKRKVALISGVSSSTGFANRLTPLTGVTGQDGSYL